MDKEWEIKAFKDKTEHIKNSIGALYYRNLLSEKLYCIECSKTIDNISSKFVFLDPDKIVCAKCYGIMMTKWSEIAHKIESKQVEEEKFNTSKSHK